LFEIFSVRIALKDSHTQALRSARSKGYVPPVRHNGTRHPWLSWIERCTTNATSSRFFLLTVAITGETLRPQQTEDKKRDGTRKAGPRNSGPAF
tara:strand:+ start:69106 stop:69387 length:282 start_codon:yes stop_codon:yes gene_type:complete